MGRREMRRKKLARKRSYNKRRKARISEAITTGKKKKKA
jgi:hypothetical protein